MKKALISLFLYLFFNVPLFAQVFSGTYTIGGSGANYATITAAVNALKNGVVGQPVTFNIRPGTYSERVTIPLINGVSATNTITFQSETGNAKDVKIIGSGLTGADNHIFHLNGTLHIIIKDLTLINNGKSHAAGVVVNNTSGFCKVTGCIIRLDSLSTFNENSAGVNGSDAHGIEVIGNKIYGGQYGVRFFGSSVTVSDVDNIVSDNDIYNSGVYGVHFRYNHSFVTSGNLITTTPDAVKFPQSGISALNGTFREINANRINNCRIYGIYFQNIEGVGSAIIANNMIGGGFETRTTSAGPFVNAAVFMRNSNNVNFIHNSVNYDAIHPSGAALYIDEGPGTPSGSRQITVQNNILASTGGCMTYHVVTPDLILISDYNDLYTSGPVLAFWNGLHSNLASLKAESGLDQNSLSVEPRFFKLRDLHTAHPVLDNFGDFNQLVTQDFDGEDRNSSTPDIGADEYTVNALDIAVSSIYPDVVPVNDDFSITAEFRNDGLSSLKNNTINVSYSVDGGTTWSTPEAFTITGLETNFSTEVFTFSTKAKVTELKTHSFCVRINNPGITADPNKINDQYCADICVGLNGTYTIGGTDPDYPTLLAAADALKPCGVGGAVTFKIRPGVYEERLTLGSNINSTFEKQVIFESETGNASDVLITSAGGGSMTDHHTIMLKKAKYVQLKDLTVQNTDDVLASCIYLAEGSSFNLIQNCILIGDTTTESENAVPLLVSSKLSLLSSDNLFNNNDIRGGYYGIKIQGVGVDERDKGNAIKNNTLSNQRKTGILTLFSDISEITDNRIELDGKDSTSLGISVQFAKSDFKINYNYINETGTGIMLSQDSGLTEAIIGNNAVIAYHTGIYSLNTYNASFLHNSVLCSGDETGTALLLDGGNVKRVVNNIFSNKGEGYASYINESATYIEESDHNCLYTEGTNLAYYNGDHTDLESLKTATGQEQNSLSADPQFFSETDLHTINIILDEKGANCPEITLDMDGEARGALGAAPDIGADEFEAPVPGIDAAILEIVEPGDEALLGDPIPVTIRIKNTGTPALSNINLQVNINGVMHDTGVYPSLLPAAQADYTFSKAFEPSEDGTYTITAFVNIAGDINTANDTVEKIIEIVADGIASASGEMISVFPNPFNEKLFIRAATVPEQLILIDELGRECIIAQGTSSIGTAFLKPGMYTLKILDKKQVRVLKVIKYE